MTRLAASRRASASICLQQQLARLVGGQPGDALQLALAFGDQLLGARERAAAAAARAARAACSRRAQVLLEPVGRRRGGRPARGSCRRAPVRGRRFPAGARGPGVSASAASSCAFSRASSAASLRSVSASRSAWRVTCSASARARSIVSPSPPPGGPPVGDRAAGDRGGDCGIGEVDRRHSHGCPRRNMAAEVPRQPRRRVTVRATSARPSACSGGGRLMPGRPVVPAPGREVSLVRSCPCAMEQRKRPRFAVWGGRMNLRRAGGTAAQAALQASSYRGMHTTQRRDSLRVKHWLKRASEPSRTKQGAQTPGTILLQARGRRRD